MSNLLQSNKSKNIKPFENNSCFNEIYGGKQFGTQLYVLQGLSTLCWEGVEEDRRYCIFCKILKKIKRVPSLTSAKYIRICSLFYL